LLVRTSFNAAYAEPGYLLYLRDDKTLMAQSFDPQRYILSGEPHTISDEVMYMPLIFRAAFSVAGGGSFRYANGKRANSFAIDVV
jgi:hypothetical protein